MDKFSNKSIKLKGFRPGILCQLGNTCKETHSGQPHFYPILSVIGTSTDKLAKLLMKFLTASTADEYAVVDSFHFAEQNNFANKTITYTMLA